MREGKITHELIRGRRRRRMIRIRGEAEEAWAKRER